MQEFISVTEARAIIIREMGVQPVETVTLKKALGKTLAADVISKDYIPPFPNSGMDGYAVKSTDFEMLPVTLSIIEEIAAGSVPVNTIEPGTCSKIMTGAPVPSGADAVVPVEWVVEEKERSVMFDKVVSEGINVRLAGQDVQKGERVIQRGRIVTPPVIGMLATLGFPDVDVHIPPAVAIIATGDELIEPGEALTPGKIRNSSGAALRAQVQSAGGNAMGSLWARDEKGSIRETIDKALEADVLIFAGGVSVGDYDLVKEVLDERGMELLFWKVRQRPGKPLAFGLLGGKPVFGLPGNPVSSAICFEQYVRPALGTMLGQKEIHRPLYPAVLGSDTPKVKGLHFFARGIAHPTEDGILVVNDTGPQGSNLYSSMVYANCIIHIDEDVEVASAGMPVKIEWLPW